jgi:hypothetical protein
MNAKRILLVQVKSLKRNILGMIGIAPVHETLIGSVADAKAAQTQQWLAKLHDLGTQAE